MSEELVRDFRQTAKMIRRMGASSMEASTLEAGADTIEALTARIAQLDAELAGARDELRLMSEQLDAANAALLAQERTDD